MLWVIVWVVLVVGALAVLFLLGRMLWRKAGALGREMSTAAERLDGVAARLESLSVADDEDVPAAAAASTGAHRYRGRRVRR